jgi:hypothetical protein
MPVPQRDWEVTRGDVTTYASVNAREVSVGSHRGSGHTDHCSSCSHQEFRAGRLQQLVRDGLGPAVLLEMLAALEQPPR